MRYKVKILSKGVIWGDVEWREVDESGLAQINQAAEEGRFGKHERYVHLVNMTMEEREQNYPTVEIEGVTNYLLPKEYEVIVEDITVEYKQRLLEEKQEREDRENNKIEVKSFVKWLNESTLDSKLKKILKVLIREALGK